jgi:hypothetical protein
MTQLRAPGSGHLVAAAITLLVLVVTYAVDGKQYIGAASGTPSSFWVDKNGGAPTIVIFAVR